MANPDWQCGRSGIAAFRVEFFHLTKCVQPLSRWIHLLPLMIPISLKNIQSQGECNQECVCWHSLWPPYIDELDCSDRAQAPQSSPTPTTNLHRNRLYQVLQPHPTQIIPFPFPSISTFTKTLQKNYFFSLENCTDNLIIHKLEFVHKERRELSYSFFSFLLINTAKKMAEEVSDLTMWNLLQSDYQLSGAQCW